MQPLTSKPDDGATAYIEPTSTDSSVCDLCAAESGATRQSAGLDGARGGASVQAPEGTATAASRQGCTGECRVTTADLPARGKSLAGRHWYVAEDRLLGIDLTDTDGRARASAIPFTIDGHDLFQYEDVSKVRLQFTGESTVVALAGALAFLRSRYESLRPANALEIPSTPCMLHRERLVVRFREWLAATTADVTELDLVK
jgi:hypothetical protein